MITAIMSCHDIAIDRHCDLMVAVEIHDYLVSIVSIGKTETTLTLCYVL